METILLIIKNGNDYVRVKGEEYHTCTIDKASVFPMEKLELVKKHVESMKQNGFDQPAISRLVLKEEAFQEPV